nr:hypothetical protein [uncultured Prevotella sp.]
MKKSNDEKDFAAGFRGMRLLNPAKMSDLTGGRKPLQCGSHIVYQCAVFEVKCTKGFTYHCTSIKFTTHCSSKQTVDLTMIQHLQTSNADNLAEVGIED